MSNYVFEDVSIALPTLLSDVLQGDEVGSRGGDRVLELLHSHIELANPTRREVLTPNRRALLPAQIAETMWVLAGRNDVEWLERYLPRAGEFSDDGEVWRGGYGPRLRAWPRRGDMHDVVDQIAGVVNLLKRDPLSRRAVISIFDPDTDSKPGLDIPCNNWLHFTSRKGYLDLHVATRSNDLMWGWSGINAFEWSALQEIIAGLLGISVGSLHFSITSLHLYERHWSRAKDIVETKWTSTVYKDSPRFDASVIDRDLEKFYGLVDLWMAAEEKIRNGQATPESVAAFPEPMLRSWLQIIGYWWTGSQEYLEPLLGTRLVQALVQSPTPKRKPVEEADQFTDFVVNLHKEKHAAYGDSWKRRGEMIGILANIARKVDRLGVGGAGDTSADTAMDLLIYLVKYRIWLSDHDPEVGYPSSIKKPIMKGAVSDHHRPVEDVLRSLPRVAASGAPDSVNALETALRVGFESLEYAMENRDSTTVRADLVWSMIGDAVLLARTLHGQETWKADNATRFWKGYDQ